MAYSLHSLSPNYIPAALPNFTIFEKKAQPQTKRGRPVTYNKPGHEFREHDMYTETYFKPTIMTQRCKRGNFDLSRQMIRLHEI